MLPFLREQNKFASNSEQPAAADQTPVDINSQAPVDADGRPQEQKYITVTDQHQNVRKSTIMLMALFGIGLLGLWLMIKKTTPAPLSATTVSREEAQIEAAITRLTGSSAEMASLDEIVKKFYEFSDVKQLKIDELTKNPFKMDRLFGGLKEIPGIGPAEKGFSLVTICQTDRGNCCMIDDKILYEGSSIRGYKVRQIGPNFVKLEQNNSEIILKLSE
jgi:hypothetical protein